MWIFTSLPQLKAKEKDSGHKTWSSLLTGHAENDQILKAEET